MISKETADKLVENISNFPHNITAAIRLTSRATNVGEGALRTHYYRNIRPNTPLFFIKTAKGLAINSKIFAVKKETKRTLKLEGQLINIEDLSNDEKVAFFDLIFKPQ